MTERLRVATCAYPIEPMASIDALRDKLDAWVGEAARAGAKLLVFPEYAALELTAALPAEVQRDLTAQLDAIQPLFPAYLDTIGALAKRHDVYILAGSFPERSPRGAFRNRARLVSPRAFDQPIEKVQMTRFERERWGVGGGKLRLVESLGVDPLGPIGVAICYDAEFPRLVRRLVAGGARIVLVPSCTDTIAGYWRVRIACQARALENQCYVVQASTVGLAPWSIALDENHGAAAVYAPPDRGFPDDGVVVTGALDQPGWAYADLDLAAIDRVRADGAVLNHRDWDLPGHVGDDLARSTLR